MRLGDMGWLLVSCVGVVGMHRFERGDDDVVVFVGYGGNLLFC
jgi:hypothetical protein